MRWFQRLRGDLRDPVWMYLKAVLFGLIFLLSATLILLEAGSVKIVLLLALLAWSAARLYYFLFYVIEHYVDPNYRYAGVIDCLRYLYRARKRKS